MSDIEPQRPRHPLEGPSREELESERREDALRTGRSFRVVWPRSETPWLTWGLLGLIVAIFFVSFVNPKLYNDMIETGALYWPYVVERGEWWRIITSMFLHVNIAHLGMNGLSLYSLGRSREGNDGRLRFFMAYFLSGIAGALLHLLLGGHDSPAIGASGAIFGLAGVEIVFLRRHQAFYGKAAQSAWMQLISLLGLQLFIGFSVSGIANWAHVGGLIMGIAWAWLYGPRYVVPQQIPEKGPDGVGILHAKDTLPFSRRRLWGLGVFAAVLVISGILIKLLA